MMPDLPFFPTPLEQSLMRTRFSTLRCTSCLFFTSGVCEGSGRWLATKTTSCGRATRCQRRPYPSIFDKTLRRSQWVLASSSFTLYAARFNLQVNATYKHGWKGDFFWMKRPMTIDDQEVIFFCTSFSFCFFSSKA